MPLVLIVDDEPTVLRVLRKELEGEPYEIRTAANAAEALAILDRHEADVLVTDQRMPGMSGLQLIEQVRGRHPRTVFILLTYQRERDLIRDRGPREVIYRTLLKPWEFGELRHAIHCALETARLRDENDRLRHMPAAAATPPEDVAAPTRTPTGTAWKARCALEMLVTELRDGGENRTVRRTARYVRRLVDSLLASEGENADSVRSESLAVALRRVFWEMEEPAALRGARLALELSENEPAAVDPDALESALFPLLAWTIGHAPADSTVAVRVASENGRVRVTIEDEGRSAAAASPNGGGSQPPLLAQASMALARVGGTLEIEPRPEGGNHYSVLLPIVGEAREPEIDRDREELRPETCLPV